MNCGQIEAMLPPYLDGDLPDTEVRRLESHIDRCGNCAALLRYLRRTDAVVRGWPEAPRRMRPFLARIDAAVLPEIRARSVRSPFLSTRPGARTRLRLAGGATALLVAVVALASLLASGPPGTPRPPQGSAGQQVAGVARFFVEDARRSLSAAGTRSFDPRAAARARSYLAPGYSAGLDEFRRAWGGSHVAEGDPVARPVWVDGDRATVLVSADGDAENRLRLRLERMNDRWLVTRIEPAR